ncbi:MAG TPA: hypothetical protein VGG33_21100 [Polyangia bacterium]
MSEADETRITRLHSPLLHALLVGGNTAVFGILTVIIAGIIFSYRDQPPVYILLVIPLIFVHYGRENYWRARAAYLTDEHLVMGHGPRARRIPLSDITRVERHATIRSETWSVPVEVTLRGGDSVLFFPRDGGMEVLTARAFPTRGLGDLA